jgi:hypothetical protein
MSAPSSARSEVMRVRTPQRDLAPFYVLMLVPVALLTVNVWTVGDELGLSPLPTYGPSGPKRLAPCAALVDLRQ